MAKGNADKQVMLLEYQEAGQACRNNESLVRTGISLFTAVQVAILGFIQTRNCVTLETLLLEILALVVSVVTFLTIIRLQMLYTAYMKRAKEIEAKLKMKLYTAGWRYMETQKPPAQKIKNKRLLAAIPVVVFGIYAVLFVRDVKMYFFALY